MTKALLCVACVDVLSPWRDWQTNPSWRWCQCGLAGVRWVDGRTGLIAVTSANGQDGVRVLGLDNGFLLPGITAGFGMDEDWRVLHQEATTSAPNQYLFNDTRRACWAVIVKVGQSGDVVWVPWGEAHP